MSGPEEIRASDLVKLMEVVKASAELVNAMKARGTAYCGMVSEPFLTLDTALWELGLAEVPDG